ncbi:hypothetical protein COL5a_009026 [Colletotrichum fioriniae]|nr:uncharacterized protein COL516b_012747 [Colletotrichum fioriniae]KAJ0295266.1 hypothetical protein COL516b_012747 [Colletotrichum fioriniae]KAJ0321842.1 hypothetical protein COL5a_009026 [Colletotrichum fioriniae]
MPKRTRAEKRARTAAAREAKRLKTTSGESGGSPTHDDDPPAGDGLPAEEETTQEVGGGEGGSEPPPSLPPGGREAVPPYPSGTPGAEGLLERVPPPFGAECLGCIKSALSGRTEGWCLPGSSAGSKCARCQAGKKSGCAPLQGRTRELGEKFLRLKRAKKENPAETPQKDLTRVTAALREALAADGLLGEVKDEVARVDEASAREASMGALSVLEAQLKEPVEEEKVPAASRAKADGIRIGIDTLVGIHVPADVVPALKSLLDEYALALSGK